jgi:hypothetical protein
MIHLCKIDFKKYICQGIKRSYINNIQKKVLIQKFQILLQV